MSGLVSKNSIHHFGDSYGTVKYPDHFVHLIANKLGVEYYSYCNIGDSNELIFQKILEQYTTFKPGDIVFVNFSFVNRGCYYDYEMKRIMPSNNFYNEIYDTVQHQWLQNVKEKEKINLLLDYYLNYDDDYNRRLFRLIDTFFISLFKDKKIQLYYIFIDEADYSNELLTIGNNIKFEGGFGKWLLNKGWHTNEDCHYSLGIQPELAEIVLEKVNYFKQSII